MQVIFWISLIAIYYVYDGYKRVLQLLVRVASSEPVSDEYYLVKITILLTVHNEVEELQARLNNILNTCYPANLLDVVVASDGSTDGTDELVKNFADDRVRLFRPASRLGKTATQNLALSVCCGDIVVFTDAGTRFAKNFLLDITAPFSNCHVGAVDGHLQFLSDTKTGLTQGQGYYWSYELSIRSLESRLGILAVVSGACFAVRKHLLKPMNPSTGEDCLVPLDVVRQGYEVVHASKAVAYDKMDREGTQEFKTRVRMTLRNWQGTWSRADLLNPFLHPTYAFALWSHKILRWLSPVFFIFLTVTSLFGYIQDIFILKNLFFVVLLFHVSAAIGWWAEKHNLSIPIVRTSYVFALANMGFLFGIIKALLGDRVRLYR